MAQDQFGNYICDISPISVSPLPDSMFGGNLYGAGVPDNSLGDNGNVYVNTINGDIYSKAGDVWTVATGGTGPAGGSGESGSGTPEGAVAAAVGTTYVDVDTGDFWVKQSGASTNAGWINITTYAPV